MPPPKKKKGRSDFAGKIVTLVLTISARLSRVFNFLSGVAGVLFLPQLTSYQQRTYAVLALQVFSSDAGQLCVAKFLQIYYNVPNLLLVLSLGSSIPFLYIVNKIWWMVPCPAMASVISNLALLASLLIFVILAAGQQSASVWSVYAVVMAAWPWMVLCSMISRLYTERNPAKNPFSPVRETPILGLISAGAYVLMFYGAKSILLSDCLVLIGLDSVVSALFATLVLGRHRQRMHWLSLKVYALMLLMAYFFIGGEIGPGQAQVNPPTTGHIYFICGRCLLALRSMVVKQIYIRFYQAEHPHAAPETGLLFYNSERPKKHRFSGFPGPMLLTLDAVFDSALKDMDLHAMGPLGTWDLCLLTEGSFTLPVSALCSYLLESETLGSGPLPPVLSTVRGQTAVSVAQQAIEAAALSNTGAAGAMGAAGVSIPTVVYPVMPTDYVLIVLALLLFVGARMASPWATSMGTFDRGSSLHNWKYQPILCVAPFFMVDLLFLNGSISKFQIVMALLLVITVAMYRASLFDNFKRKYLLQLTRELQYFQPSCLRSIQRQTLVEYLGRSSTDDYGILLMETSIRHGGNIKELARDTGITVWDPAPSATAAWKLAMSLVLKALRRQKLLRRAKIKTKAEIVADIEKLVLGIVYEAVDNAVGHGKRLQVASTLSQVVAKRRAIQRFRSFALARRTLRQRRKMGQLSDDPMTLTVAAGTLRSVKHLQLLPPPDAPLPWLRVPLPTLPPVPSIEDAQGAGATQASQMLSLTAETQPFSRTMTMGMTMKNQMPGEAEDPDSEQDRSAELSRAEQALAARRGVWGMLRAEGRAPGGRLVIAFGDHRRGQLGSEPELAARTQAKNLCVVVEELRGQNALMVEAAGVSSFVVGTTGQLWGFGSNRSMELGLRKEVTQVHAPQRVKTVRGSSVIQVAGSKSTAGQAYTHVLSTKGEVYSFGTSALGALGLGNDVRQTAPVLMRMSLTEPIKLICCGARHTLLVTDRGVLYSCGDNRLGQLGVDEENFKGSSQPMPVCGALKDAPVRAVACGDDHSLVLTEAGRLFAWGANANGQLGLGRLDHQLLPVEIKDLKEAGIISMACGARHSIVAARGGRQILTWGSNVQGQLGTGEPAPGDERQVSVPTINQTLTNLPPERRVIQVAAASSHTLVLTLAGEVYAFGDNSFGQLGFRTAEVPDGGRFTVGAQVTHQWQQQEKIQPWNRSGRTKLELDVPKAYDAGVTQLWLPERVVGLSHYRITSVSTADSHTLVLAA